MNKIIIGIGVVIVFMVGIFFIIQKDSTQDSGNALYRKGVPITNFEECALAGNPVMESYPRQCRSAEGILFIEDIVSSGSGMIEAGALVTYFTVKLQERVVTIMFQPIEGFEPFMFMDVYPGLISEDFEGVKSLQGIYEIKDGNPEFRLTVRSGEPIHSAGQAISNEGMATLLGNVSKRLDISVDDEGSINSILNILSETSGEEALTHACAKEEREADFCIQIYAPVCGKVNVQCITTPCPPVYETFSNACEACKNSLAESYSEGECS